MFYKVESVDALDNYLLLITFQNGIKKQYDIKPLFEKWKEFKTLYNNLVLFKNVKVDAGGYGISWNDNLDISCTELWNNGMQI